MSSGRAAHAGLFYVHVMKTGGTSVGRRLREAFGAEFTYPELSGFEGRMFFVEMLEERLRENRPPPACVIAHMPAWTAEELTPDHLRATVLRDPFDRTVSHLRQLAEQPELPSSLDDLYHLADFRARLSEYQTRLFSLERAPASDEISSLDRQELEATVRRSWLTAMPSDAPVDDRDLERAIARLEAFDIVGVTEELDRFIATVATATGVAIDAAAKTNRTRSTAPVSDELAAQIRADTARDRILFERAVELSQR